MRNTKVHASKKELEALPDWAADFLSAAWAPPDERGQRAPLDHFEGIREIGERFAARLREAIEMPGVRWHSIAFVVDVPAEFIETDVFLDKQMKIVHGLMRAWNGRANLALCEVCGNLMQPGKGRIARTCSDVCRLKLHREGR